MRGKKIAGIMIVIIVVAGLVVAAGNTYVTASGIWLGYRWHPINASEQNDTDMKVGNADLEQMNDIVEVINNDGSISNRMSGDGYKTIKKIDKIAKIKEFREVYFDDSHGSYCVFENDKGGMLVVAVYRLSTENKKETNVNCIPCGAFYLEKTLRFEDFKEINVGSDRKDVAKIDPAADVKMKYDIDGELLETTDAESIHITMEGYLHIKYDENGIVTEMNQNESDMIHKVITAQF